jgi:NifU-like protein involved in Fe-S cluster formation
MALHAKWVAGVLIFYDGATEILSIDPDGTVDVKVAGKFKLEGATFKQAAEADLNQTIAGPTIAEVQAISDKVDALLAKLRLAKVLST